ncbi:MAG TPA: UDP-2,3-diacylglucosamine diphosphatase, partial [Gammaproteobacteria bacterium]|nr:UDP-2,3-diacylglucosamine diphosphatase [Gammaproteobacteria bacterium]
DLHLSEERPEQIERFDALVDRASIEAERVFLLGDLVEAWLGDDDERPPHPQLMRGLSRLTAAGVQVFVAHGNRDFLMGERFAASTGVSLIPESLCIDVNGQPALVMHGDALCTLDVSYQQIRRTLRDPAWQARMLVLPFEQRLALAQQYRDQSLMVSSRKDESIMDVTPAAVEASMREAGVRLLIHGHTHRPARHLLELDGAAAERIVLGDWYGEAASVLVANGETLVLTPLAQYLSGARPEEGFSSGGL